jgi:hypothetical protein
LAAHCGAGAFEQKYHPAESIFSSRRIYLVAINARLFMYIMCSGAISNILGRRRAPEAGRGGSESRRRFWAQLGEAKMVLLAHPPIVLG